VGEVIGFPDREGGDDGGLSSLAATIEDAAGAGGLEDDGLFRVQVESRGDDERRLRRQDLDVIHRAAVPAVRIWTDFQLSTSFSAVTGSANDKVNF
jgi:hypothetical protein